MPGGELESSSASTGVGVEGRAAEEPHAIEPDQAPVAPPAADAPDATVPPAAEGTLASGHEALIAVGPGDDTAQAPGEPADPLPRRQFFRAFVGEAFQAATSVAEAAGGLEAGLREEALSLARAAGIGFGDTLDLDAPVTGVGAAATTPELPAYHSPYRAGRDGVVVLDQRRVPAQAIDVPLLTVRDVASAVRDGLVRGPGTIASVAAYALARGATARSWLPEPAADPRPALLQDAGLLVAAAPAVTPLRRALDRLLWRASASAGAAWEELGRVLWAEADTRAMDEMLELGALADVGGRLLAELAGRVTEAGPRAEADAAPAAPPAPRPLRVLVHGPIDALAYGQLGLVTGVLTATAGRGVPVHAWITEGRPSGSGALTAWELRQAGLTHDVIPDSTVGGAIAAGAIDAVVLGALGVGESGFVVDEPGSYQISLLAARHGVPTYVCLLRSALFAEPLRPSPAADVTPADLVTAFLTAAGVVGPPFEEALRAFVSGPADASGAPDGSAPPAPAEASGAPDGSAPPAPAEAPR